MEFSRFVAAVVVIVIFGAGLERFFMVSFWGGGSPGGICAHIPTLTSVCAHRAQRKMPDTLLCHCPP